MGPYLIEIQHWLTVEKHHYENDTADLFRGRDGVVAGMKLSFWWRSEFGDGAIVAPRVPPDEYAVPHEPQAVPVAPQVLQLFRNFFI